MNIACLQIDNFRGIRHGRISFGRHTVFVGANNCGKTTVLEALALLFGRDRLIRTLTEHDFFGGDPQPLDRIRLVATIVGFEGNDPAQHRDWFSDGLAAEKWYDPTTCSIHPEADPAGAWQLACEVVFSAYFDRTSLEVETLRYFNNDEATLDPFIDRAVTTVPAHLIRQLGLFLIPADRSWDRVISFGSELFRRVVESFEAKPASSVIAERDRLRTPVQPLDDDPNLAPIIRNLDQELAGFFRSAPQLRLRLTTTDSAGVLDAVIPHYSVSGNAPALPARRHGSGLVSLQRLLLLLNFGRRRAEADENFWMALEEPELHVPPPLQRRLVHRLQALSTQTFVTTHSPMVAALADPETVSILRNDDGNLSAVKLLSHSLPISTNSAVRKLFQLNRLDTISAIMHDVLLIPEGRIDRDWLELLLRAVDANQGWSAGQECHFGSYVGVVPTHNGAVVPTFNALRSLHPRVIALVDGDSSGKGYISELTAMKPQPSEIVRWPDNWAIEEVVGWLLEADEAAALAELRGSGELAASTVRELVAQLKSMDRVAMGLKQDNIAYEAIGDAIASTPLCAERARGLLNSLAEVCLSRKTAAFQPDPNQPAVMVFRP